MQASLFSAQHIAQPLKTSRATAPCIVCLPMRGARFLHCGSRRECPNIFRLKLLLLVDRRVPCRVEWLPVQLELLFLALRIRIVCHASGLAR